jgi:hypothetical protein
VKDIAPSSEYNFSVPSCGTCHYSRNGRYPCGRMLDNMLPKIDISKGVECAHNNFVHYLKFGTVTDEEMKAHELAHKRWLKWYQNNKERFHSTKVLDEEDVKRIQEIGREAFVAEQTNKEIKDMEDKVEYTLQDIIDAVQYGFDYRTESQNDGKKVPTGNVLQWLMAKKELIDVPDEFREYQKREQK